MKRSNIASDVFFWALQALCSINNKPFSLSLAQQQLAAPYSIESLSNALVEYGFEAKIRKIRTEKLYKYPFPLVAWLAPIVQKPDVAGQATIFLEGAGDEDVAEVAGRVLVPGLILQADSSNVLMIEPGAVSPKTYSLMEFNIRYQGCLTSVREKAELEKSVDNPASAHFGRKFGFSWFIPELLKHKKLWQEILLASLVIQLIALATPLFTQAIIDKVVVHHTQSTLIVIAIGMAVFMVFSAILSWLRQYLVLHTGNRVDSVLGASVFERLFKLPPLYFQHRPTGVIAARLHGVETIREFVASAAVTLVLDLPFLLIFVGIMFYYSVTLTCIVLSILSLIIVLSLAIAPLFQSRLQRQFQLGARNQAFLTEYIVGLETVKSLQLEPQLNSRYGAYLANYLAAGFETKQLANTYNTFAGLLEQVMGLLVLGVGAWTVMHHAEFTIGMLVAFQMFSGRLSQPMMRLVGLWQQFQQASLSVARLADLMNAPTEPYSVLPARSNDRKGTISIEGIAFKYAEHLPLIYENLCLLIEPGQTIGIMGASGCGKSTLAKLLQGFYQPSAGRIMIDGVDVRYLSANELRSYFGVVPQETVLFSGTIYDNLQMASPNANFEQIVAACKMAEIHGAIEALPQGYQTEIGERGAGLSGGQKQRVAIARALLKRPSILVFDEATSALDASTAEQFARTINALKGKVTMLFITHGLPRGLNVDAIYRLGPHGAERLPIAVHASGIPSAPSDHDTADLVRRARGAAHASP